MATCGFAACYAGWLRLPVAYYRQPDLIGAARKAGLSARRRGEKFCLVGPENRRFSAEQAAKPDRARPKPELFRGAGGGAGSLPRSVKLDSLERCLPLRRATYITSESVANEDTCPVKSHFRSFFGNTHHLRHLSGVELLHIAEDQDQTVVLGEGQNGCFQPTAQFLIQDNLFRRGLPRFIPAPIRSDSLGINSSSESICAGANLLLRRLIKHWLLATL